MGKKTCQQTKGASGHSKKPNIKNLSNTQMNILKIKGS